MPCPRLARQKNRRRRDSLSPSSRSTAARSSGYGMEFSLKGRWGFQYTNTCSRPRLNAFGGGAHVIDLGTGETLGWIDTDGWLAAAVDGGNPDA